MLRVTERAGNISAVAGRVLGSIGRIAAHIDVRGNAGYVIAPPSVHPGGHIYALDRSQGVEIAPAPQWIVALALPDDSRGELCQFGIADLAPKFEPALIRHHEAGLERKIAGIIGTAANAREGERNSIIFWASCRLRALIAAGSITEHLALNLLIEAGSRAGLSVAEIRATARSGLGTRPP